MYGWGNYGLAGDYYSLLAQANLQDCDPRDSECVSNNVAKQAAVEDLWVSKYMTQAGGAPSDLVLSFTPQTDAQVHEFYAGDNPYSGGNVVDTRNILAVGRGDSTPVVYNPMPVTPSASPVPPVAPKIIDVKPVAGKTVISSSGPSESTSMLPWTAPGGVSIFSSIPWWAWLAGGGVALYAMKGRH